jgi:DNA-binding MarR family transcriptional regulator
MTGNKHENEELSSIKKIDRIIHEPGRLMIMAHLYVVESADFLFLKRQIGLTWGNLSAHLSKLETAGYIAVEKEFVDKKPRTTLHLTEGGRTAFHTYRQTMKQMFDDFSIESSYV